ncbi:MAG TPA: hypothetical protein VNE62_00475 [Actinomycetota bacterium]|nr:hypothetical protein [Actinomycetota bacterium]
MRKLLTITAIALLVLGACRPDDTEETSRRTTSPRTSETPDSTPPGTDFALEGTIRYTLSPSAATTGRTDLDDDLDATDDASSPRATGAAGTDDDEEAAGFVVVASSVDSPLQACGFENNDQIAVYYEGPSVFEPETVVDNARFPQSLAGQRVAVTGVLLELAGQCVLEARQVQVNPAAQASGSPRGTLRPGTTATPRTGTGTRTPTPTPRRTSSPTATVRVTSAPTTAPTADATP